MGYTSAQGRVHGSKLVTDLNNWLGQPLSHAFRLNENGIVHCHWAYQFLARERASISPLKYTLLSVFLGAEPDELAHSSSSLKIPPIGDCGRNSGGVHASLLRFKRARSKLRKLWNNPSISVGEITRRLEISHITACKWALRLNLDFPRKGPSPVPAPRMTQAQFLERRNRKRSEWLVSASGLRGGAVHNPKTGELYRWLGNYDANWLRKHWPKYRKIEKTDWKTRDTHLVQKLTQAAKFLLEKKRPCWLSKTRLLHEIRYTGFRYRGHRSKLPKAYKLLIKFSETRAAFTARRLRHL